jgi:hypothetical protein
MKAVISLLFIFICFTAFSNGYPFAIKLSSSAIMKGDTIWMELSVNDSNAENENLKWYSSIDGYLASGNKISTNNLSTGNHKITVKNSQDEQTLLALNELLVEKYIPSEKMTELIDWMTGYFSSKNQADTSSDKYHVDVRLRMCRIWENRTDGFWIYVEQAYASDTTQPYRQRLYHMIEANGSIKDEIYGIKDDSLYLFGWQKPEIFNNLSDTSIVLKENCGLDFKFQGSENVFEAKTSGCNCKASIPRVAYITSVSKIHNNYLTSWDLGFNETGEIVMGPESPYIFEKTSNYDCKIK